MSLFRRKIMMAASLIPTYVTDGLIDLWENFTENGTKIGSINGVGISVENCTFEDGVAIGGGTSPISNITLDSSYEVYGLVIIGSSTSTNGFVIDNGMGNYFRWYVLGQRVTLYYTKNYETATYSDFRDSNVGIYTSASQYERRNSAQPTTIGANSGATDFGLNFRIKAIMLYNRQITQEESVKIAKWLNRRIPTI